MEHELPRKRARCEEDDGKKENLRTEGTKSDSNGCDSNVVACSKDLESNINTTKKELTVTGEIFNEYAEKLDRIRFYDGKKKIKLSIGEETTQNKEGFIRSTYSSKLDAIEEAKQTPVVPSASKAHKSKCPVEFKQNSARLQSAPASLNALCNKQSDVVKVEGYNIKDSVLTGKKCFENDNKRERPEKTRVEEPGMALEDQLREFQVLDEVEGDEDEEESGSRYGTEAKSESSDDSEDTNSSGFDLDIGELDLLLEEGLPEDLKGKKKPQQYEETFKTILEEKEHNHFEVLPEGWLQVTHNSGIPLYLHKKTRVCSVSRPYFLGPGSVRKHEIPLSAIPCLNYRKALEKEQELKEKQMNGPTDIEILSNFCKNESAANNGQSIEGTIQNSSTLYSTTNAKIETVKENFESHSLTANEINEYCKKLFHFKTIRVMKFKSWAARRKFRANRKHIKNLQRPSLPDGTKLITFPVIPSEGEIQNNPRARREWIMNPNGKSYVCILHEYLQHALKKQPNYEFKELENAATPYCATVSINGLKYGTGYGTSKKQAKSEAARETLEVLIPEMRDKISSDKSATNRRNHFKDLSVFDEIKIEDPRVAEFCAKTTEPSPHTILLTCLQRNFGLGDIQIDYQVNAMKHKKNEFTMTVGKHSATVVCKNKREGKQLASQAILQILHPHIKTWGSLLRLYGNNSVKSFKEKKQEEQEITVLQSKAAINQPNYAILEKLKLEMTKLSETRDSIKPIGTFIPPSDVDLPTSSGSNLKNVEL